MSIPASYKPSPLSYGSPQRASPFRRPESPASPSPLRNSAIPAVSPSKPVGPPPKLTSPFQSPATMVDSTNWTPRGLPPAPREPERSPTKGANVNSTPNSMMGTTTIHNSDVSSMSKLQPGQVRELREGFQILDRDSDGLVGRDDVADMLTQLGLPANPSDVAPFFPTSSQTLTLPSFLTSISSLISTLSAPTELLSAFSAFDDDDSGQIDLNELRDALLHTAPEPGDQPLTEREVDKIVNGFSGRRAFTKGPGLGRKGEVFKYQEFVGALAGGNGNNKDEKAEA